MPVAVNKVVRTAQLRQLHTRVCEVLDSLHARYTMPQYVHDGYSPHITHQHGAKLEAGARHTATSVYLVRANAPEYGNDRLVCAKLPLRQELVGPGLAS